MYIYSVYTLSHFERFVLFSFLRNQYIYLPPWIIQVECCVCGVHVCVYVCVFLVDE